VTHNLVALRLVAALQLRGIHVPERLALVVTADEDWMEVVRPHLTTIALPARQLGEVAAQLLLRRLAARDDADATPASGTEQQVVVLRAPLVVRESCGARAVEAGACEEREAR